MIQIPIATGYLNFGDGLCLLAGWILGPWYGFAAAGLGGALAVLPLIAWAFFLSVCERRHEALAEEPETIPDSSAHPTSNA